MTSTQNTESNDGSGLVVQYTDLLIIGAGPAGASLACFLASYGLKGIVVASTPGTADSPRAHITNMAALECLRDIGLEEECIKVSTHSKNMMHTRWTYTFAGEEFARIYSWGHDPQRHGDYAEASPCAHVDLPQTLLEPILTGYATRNGFKVRFDTKFLSFEEGQKDGTILSTLEDRITGRKYQIRSKYLFGADGGRSQVVHQLGLPLEKKPGQGLAINVLAEADMSHLMETRTGNLHWVVQPDVDHPKFAWTCIVRMVKPWHEWMFIILPDPEAGTDFNPTHEQYMERIRQFIGDDSVKVKIKAISNWYINEIVAEQYSRGNIHCLGDAVHRHPPFNGLGSNTCVQDAYNLAWKIAYVEKGLAGPEILKSFNDERQPVGKAVITRANNGLRDHTAALEALGAIGPDAKTRKAMMDELKEDSPAGRDRRKRLQEGIKATTTEFHALGIEMNQRYDSNAVYKSDQGPQPAFQRDELLYHQRETYPGSRLPHVWLREAVPTKFISTIDLAGKRRFSLFTGIGGAKWKDAAKKVSENLGVEIATFSIGFRQEYEDTYYDWAKLRGIEESGCVLVRPDRFVAWRSNTVIDDCDGQLELVMKTILSR